MAAFALATGMAAPALASDDAQTLTTYVKARAADAQGDSAFAAAAYGDVLNAAPDNEIVAIRAYREALAAGDMALALKAQALLDGRGLAPVDGALLVVADRLAHSDAKGVEAALTKLEKTPFDFMIPIIRAWQRYDRDPDGAIRMLDASQTSAFGRRYAMESLALMELGAGRADTGIARLQTLGLNNRQSLDIRVAAAQLLAGRGEAERARSLVEGSDSVFTALRGRLSNGPKASARFGVARLYARLAGELTSDATLPLAVMLARCALLIDNSDDHARLVLADSLSRSGSFGSAQKVLASIPTDSIFSRVARGAEIVILTRAGDEAAALQTAAALARDGSGSEIRVYADLLMQGGQYAQAAAAYARARGKGGAGPDWALLLAEGSALERSGNWKAGLAQLTKAADLAPEEPLVLNYLGYAMLERGDNVAAAQKLIERAHSLKPDDAAITDSLGWAYFIRGDIARALPLIEKAAQGQPADSDIQEHLGDIYWKLGRKFEARYAWRAAALTAEGDQAARIAGKLGGGPPAAKP